MDFEGLVGVLDQFMPKALVQQFEKAYSKEDGEPRVKFPSRVLSADEVSKPNSPLALRRSGYRFNQNVKFHQIIKDGNYIVKNMADFNLFILSVFYFISGEEYDSRDMNKNKSYHTRESGTQIIIGC